MKCYGAALHRQNVLKASVLRGGIELLYNSAERCYDSTALFAIDWNIVKIFPFVSMVG